jgi:RNA polymerase sigma-70 factor, ECF subfamily
MTALECSPVFSLASAGRTEAQPAQETLLMARFRDQRSAADFDALYRLAAPDFLMWARGRGIAEAEELLQDTFVNIYRYASTFKDESASSFRNWSHSIAINLRRRAATRRARRPMLALEERSCEPRDPAIGPWESACGAEEASELRFAWMILLSLYREAHAALNERDRLALELVEVRGLSYANAAEKLGVGLSNLKMILFRARGRVRDHIQRRLTQRELLVKLAG